MDGGRRPASEIVFLLGLGLMALLILIRPGGADLAFRLALADVLAVAVATGVLSEILRRRKYRVVFGSRASLDDDDLFERHYSESGLDKDTLLRVWQGVGRALRIPREKLRPTDKFDDELAPADIFESLVDRRDSLARWARTEAKRFGADFDYSSPRTLDDVVRQLVRVEMRRPR
jgi:hypothetical protein